MKLKISMILAALVVSLSSCEDLFELEYPASDMPEWQTIGDLETMLVDPYEKLLSSGTWNANPVACMTNYSEAISDLALINHEISGTTFYAETRDCPFSAGGGAPDGAVAYIYMAVRSCNTLLEFIESVEAGEVEMLSALSDSETKQMSRIKGEAYFMRGYAYWLLSIAYIPPYSPENRDVVYVPYVVKSYYTAEELLAPPMGTMGQIYDLMLSDFENGKEYMEASGVDKTYIQQTRLGYANQYAASAMVMRINFIMQNWQAALAECDYIENSGLYNLSEQPIRAFNRDCTLPSNFLYAQEVLFDAAYSNVGNAADEPWAISRISKVGHGNHINTDVSGAQTDPNWLLGGCGETNWGHKNLAYVTWNRNILEYIGWIDEGEADNIYEFTPNAAAESDLRYTQLHCFLRGYVEGGNAWEHEMMFTTIDYNSIWNDKFMRGPTSGGTFLPLIRYAEVVLTRATCSLQVGDSATALTAVNEIRGRAGLDPLTSVTETEIEKERIKEMAFEFHDRITYITALRRDIPSYGKVDLNGDVVPVVPYPYDDFCTVLPDDESSYSSTAWTGL